MTDPRARVEPVIQKVPQGSRGPILVLATVVAVVGLLVAKPWETPVRPPLVAAPQSQTPTDRFSPPQPPPFLPTARPTGTPIPYPPFTPTPPASAVPSLEPGGAFNVEFEPDGEIAACIYEGSGRRRRLVSIEVPAPRAYVSTDRGTGRVRNVMWWFEILGNREETLFDEDWQRLGESGFELAEAVDGEPANFTLQHRFVEDLDLTRTSVVRTRVLVNWRTDLGDADAQSEIIATSYLLLPRPPAPPLTYCPAVIRV